MKLPLHPYWHWQSRFGNLTTSPHGPNPTTKQSKAMIKSVIIDDEAQARSVVRNLLKDSNHPIEVVGEGDDVASGLQVISDTRPDLVFLDIHLRGGSGFDLLSQLEQVPFEVVFVTAYDQYALKAFQCSAFGYLLKPVRLSELRKVLDKLQEQRRLREQARSERIKVLIESYEDQGKVQKLIVQNMQGFQVLPLNEIMYLQAEGNYTWFKTTEGERLLVSKTLKDYETLLNDFGFYRIHQSYLVNLRYIKRYLKGEGGSVFMTNEDELPVSRRKKAGFLKRFLA